MKIVHIITRLILGGAQENTLITCKLLAERGHDVTLITGPAIGPEGELFNQTKRQKYKVILVDGLRRAINPFHDISTYYELKKLLEQIKPDIVHTHSAKAGILGRLAAYNLKNSWAKNKPAVIHTIHGLAFHRYENEMVNRFYILAEKFAAKRTDFFISVADAMTEQALEAGVGTPDKYITAYSAIEQDDYLKPFDENQKLAVRAKYRIPDEAVVLVTVARLFMLKGHDYIITSAKTLSKVYPKAFWLFVGDGNMSDFFKAEVEESGLHDKIKFTGLVPPGEIPSILHASDILVHCSLREGLARAIPQAMLCQKPAIAYDLDGSKEVINQNTGRLVQPQNINNLIDACSELLDNKDLRERIGKAGREFVKDKFSPKTMVDTIESVYRKFAGV